MELERSCVLVVKAEDSHPRGCEIESVQATYSRWNIGEANYHIEEKK